jgi:peptidyl-prolyl cis-trans isomerase A (cyclophilin A)
MKNWAEVLRRSVALIVLMVSAAAAQADGERVRVLMQTTEGAIEIELFADKAPLTVANFLRYVDGGHYSDASFYRTVTFENDKGKPWIEVIQGGLGDATPAFPPIGHESTAVTGLSHEDGTISMARGDVGTAAAEFFICIGAQPGLDHGALRNPDGQGFAAFGKVTRGMDTVRRIHKAEAGGASDSAYTEGQILSEPVRIVSVSRSGADQ